MNELSPRERFHKSINHEIPDKSPLDLGGHQTGIHLQAYKRLLDFLSIDHDKIFLYDYLQQLAVPCEEILERLHIDTRTIYPPNTLVAECEDHDQETHHEFIGYWDDFGVFWGRKPTNPDKRLLYNDIINPFADFTTAKQVHEYEWPSVDDTLFKGIEDYARTLYENTDYALIGRSMGSIFQWSHYLFGLENFLKQCLKNPEMIRAAFDHLLDYCTDYARHYITRVGKYIETVQFTSDLTHQKGPIISPQLYRKLVKPYQSQLISNIKSIASEVDTEVKINFHTCGAASYFINDLAEIGIDSINPVQINAENMDPKYLKKKYGSTICFWGGLCNSQNTLPFGTPDEVKAEVKKNILILKQNGGFIGASIHNITYDVPAANVVAMFDAAEEYRKY